jgi:signal transduction histidine kinase
MTRSLLPRFPPGLHFSQGLESGFQRDYYTRIRPTLRLVSLLLTALIFMQVALAGRAPAPYDLVVACPQIVLWMLVFGLTWVRGFRRVWQPAVVVLGWLTAALVLGGLAPLLADEVMRMQGVGLDPPTIAQQKFYFIVQFAVLIVSLATLRLHFPWAALLYGGVATIGLWAFLTGLPRGPQIFLDVRFALLPGLLMVCVVLLAALTQEQLARRAFLANHQLEEERNDEKHRREQTEGKLHVLAQAIGGIVHDLGNPLTAVQTGVGTLKMFVESGDTDQETLQEFADIINDGAQMLDYLRLSLIEQTRVLEGKPIPVELTPTSLRRIIEAGARFQKPRFVSGHQISIIGDDRSVCVDEMKMTTVFMNLIGNALKYSDGEVRVQWRVYEPATGDDKVKDAKAEDGKAEDGKRLLIAVLDCGTKGTGITQGQAALLFTAFGRLDTRSQVEGTGLGLLSVQKIVEAHGGEAFIEGYGDGTPASPLFSTAQDKYPTLLHDPYRTAFVVTCPLATGSL